MKKGATTNVTLGIYDGLCLLATLRFGIQQNGPFYYFEKCYRILDDDDEFFERGDSGSGVFLIDRNSSRIQPLGIAFGRCIGSTLVCNIKHIAERFQFSILKDSFSTSYLNEYLSKRVKVRCRHTMFYLQHL